jgi:hypothetical protein
MDYTAGFTAAATLVALGVAVLATRYHAAKLKIHELHVLLEDFDETLKDDKLTIIEAIKLVRGIKTVLGIKNKALVTEENT